MNKFWMPKSPLHGHHVPLDWKRMDRNGKVAALVAAEIAVDLKEARSLLSKHGNAVRAYRKEKKEREQEEIRRRRGW